VSFGLLGTLVTVTFSPTGPSRPPPGPIWTGANGDSSISRVRAGHHDPHELISGGLSQQTR
jgi:hypothetical protein